MFLKLMVDQGVQSAECRTERGKIFPMHCWSHVLFILASLGHMPSLPSYPNFAIDEECKDIFDS